MSKIKVMDELLSNKIAAGEVVERCASVVKELIENSIDSSATEIKIELKEAGTEQIKVIDNGIGMDKEDAILSFGRHATSKLTNEEDLYNIMTLGFRGEALASIASVSKINLKTSTGTIGTEVIIHGGKILEINNSEARQGTIIIIDNLFYNTPARLKHMKSLYTELASITDYVDKIALSHPEIKFILINNGTVLLNTDGTNNLLKTINAIYGIEVTKKMIEVKSEDEDYEISGYISLPEIHRSNRNSIIILVNGRVVRNIEINRTINDSYHSYKPDNRYPIVVINISVDPILIDVNIHPTKMDIKFSKLEELLELISNMIKNSLKTKTLIPHIEVKEVINEKLNYEETKLDFGKFLENEDYIIINNKIEKENESIDSIIKFNTEFKEKKELFPELYPVGLVHGTYIICQNNLGMYLIDQHAAKERINYELFKHRLGNPNNDTISLLFPITIEFTNNEFIILKENFNILKSIGIEIEEFGVNSVIVKSHPTWILRDYEKESIEKIIETLIQVEKNFNIEKFNEKIATTLACKLSIKANENITQLEMEQLIKDLGKCNNPFNCPHGRPTIIFYSKFDLEKLFKRSGF